MQTVNDRMTKFLLRSLDTHRSLMYCSLDNIPTYRDPVGGGGESSTHELSYRSSRPVALRPCEPSVRLRGSFWSPPPPHPSNLQESTEVVRAGSNDGCC